MSVKNRIVILKSERTVRYKSITRLLNLTSGVTITNVIADQGPINAMSAERRRRI